MVNTLPDGPSEDEMGVPDRLALDEVAYVPRNDYEWYTGMLSHGWCTHEMTCAREDDDRSVGELLAAWEHVDTRCVLDKAAHLSMSIDALIVWMMS